MPGQQQEQHQPSASPLPLPGTITPTSPSGASAAAGGTVAAVVKRAHTKSRTGCRVCKRRKIKCDERRPSCNNCFKHAVRCEYLDQPPSSRLAGGGASDAHGDGVPPSLSPPSPLQMADLELLHNFTTATYATLSSDTTVRNLWRMNVVRMALECDYVMRCLLSVSALHLAYHRPERRDDYRARALQYHRAASWSAMALMQDLKAENVENLYLFSVLTIFFALASPRHEDDDALLMGESAFPDWMFLLRGSKQILHLLQPDTYAGPLRHIFAHGRERVQSMFDDTKIKHSLLRDLQEKIARSPAVLADAEARAARRSHPNRGDGSSNDATPSDSGATGASGTTADASAGSGSGMDDASEGRGHRRSHPIGSILEPDPPLGDIYDHAIDQLRRVLSVHYGTSDGPIDITDAFVWKFLVADHFLPLLRVPTQEAVAVFAHFCMLLKRLETQWWHEGWATNLLARAWEVLDEDHRLWIQWPIEELGWVPPPLRGS